jgi:hypothetical protein
VLGVSIFYAKRAGKKGLENLGFDEKRLRRE